jgi:predicted MPP superfamily phosphohydrolase
MVRLIFMLLALVLFLFVQDLLVFRYFLRPYKKKRVFYRTVQVFNIVCYVILIFTFLSHKHIISPKWLGLLFSGFAVVLSWFIYKAFLLIFYLISGTARLIRYAFEGRVKPGSNLFRVMSQTVSIMPIIAIVYGVVIGRWNFKVNDVDLYYENLPEQFDGYVVVQISDLHIGGYAANPGKLQKAVDIINSTDADVVLFTGDMVTKDARELDGLTDILSGITSKDGKYAILGNHDYGDYVKWDSAEDKQTGFDQLKQEITGMGFDLLENENRAITRGDTSIYILGMDNWGLPPFPQYGDFAKTRNGVGDGAFEILMSHDPDFWQSNIEGKSDVELTLAGHSHGMQTGIRFRGKLYSPASLKYDYWGGLYGSEDVKLYVNVGLGYVGFPARIGMPPEITRFVLHSKKPNS